MKTGQANILIEDCQFLNNSSDIGVSGLYVEGKRRLEVLRNVFVDNNY